MTEQHTPHIGAWLRGAREKAGVSLREIADATKLSVPTLAALEQNRVTRLPGGIYRRSIVRAYATHIGLPPEDTLQAFLDQHPDELPPLSSATAPAAPLDANPLPDRRTRQLIVKLLGALIPILAALFYLTLTASGAERPPVILDVPAAERPGASGRGTLDVRTITSGDAGGTADSAVN